MVGWFVFLLSWIPCSLAEKWTVADVPNPNKNPVACGRPNVKQSSICDPDNLLASAEKDTIEGFLLQIPESKAQVAVLIVNSIHPSYTIKESVEKASETFARSVHNSWGIGNAVKNNGVLVFLSVKDRSVYISTGRGVENQITKPIIEQLLDHMTPYLKKGEYSQGFLHVISEIRLVLDGKSIGSNSFFDSPYIGVVAFVLIGVGSVMYQHYASRKMNSLGKGKENLEKLMKDISDCKDRNVFASSSCPICLEDFPTSPEQESGLIDGEPYSKSDEIGKSQEKKSSKRPMSLQCGHVFCWGCLTQHLKSNESICPICRAPADPNDKTKSAPNNSSLHHRRHSSNSNIPCTMSDASSSSSSAAAALDFRRPEFIYRLNRMRYLYPNFLTNEVHASMVGALNTGDIETLRITGQRRNEEVNRILSDYRAQEAARAKGSSGSRSSFGGGRSSGGGGRRF